MRVRKPRAKKGESKAIRSKAEWFALSEIERRIKQRELTEEEVAEGGGFVYVVSQLDGEVECEEKEKLETYVWLTKDTYNKMEYAYKRHFTHAQMRAWAGINLEKWKKLVRKYPRLLEMIEEWKGFVCSKAKMNIADKIEEGDVDTSKWILEKLEREEYGKTGDNGNRNGGGVMLNLEVDMKKVEEMRALLLGKREEAAAIDSGVGAKAIAVEKAEDLVILENKEG